MFLNNWKSTTLHESSYFAAKALLVTFYGEESFKYFQVFGVSYVFPTNLKYLPTFRLDNYIYWRSHRKGVFW